MSGMITGRTRKLGTCLPVSTGRRR